MDTRKNIPHKQTGFGMIEVLVALVILLVGLLGLAGLMVQSQRSELESYQRVQALILAKDMVSRINANRNVAFNLTGCYGITNAATGTPYVGKGVLTTAVPACAASGGVTTDQANRATQDLKDWNNLLQGATESSSGAMVGAIVSARGCVSYNSNPYDIATNPGGVLLDSNGLPLAGSGVYTVEVAWQGMNETYAPVGLTCGKNLYGPDTQRRDISLTFRLGSINNTLTP